MSVGGGEETVQAELQAVREELSECRRDMASLQEERDSLQHKLDALTDKLNVAEVRVQHKIWSRSIYWYMCIYMYS